MFKDLSFLKFKMPSDEIIFVQFADLKSLRIVDLSHNQLRSLPRNHGDKFTNVNKGSHKKVIFFQWPANYGLTLGGHLTFRILSLLRYVVDKVKSSPNKIFF